MEEAPPRPARAVPTDGGDPDADRVDTRWWRAVLDASHDAIVVVDRDLRVLAWSAGAERLYGYPAAEMVGRRAADILAPDGADDTAHVVRLLEVGFPSSGEVACARKDGTRITVEATRTPINGADGELAAVVVVSREISESVVEALAARAEELRRGREATERFVANLSHELRSQLSVILGFSSCLVDPAARADPDVTAQAAEAINRQARRLDRLVHDMLTLSRLEGEVLLSADDLLLGPLAATLVRDVAAQPERWTVDVPVDLAVHADPDRLVELLTNLLVNAERHGAPPFAIRAGASGRARVAVEISDAGAGVAPGLLPYLFEPFSPGGADAGGAGSGLGLAITRALAHAQGGDIRYEANDPRGAIFVLSLPAAPSEG